jgi:hypothetical protein
MNFYIVYITSPIPVTARSKAWVCRRLLAAIAGSNRCLSLVSVVLSGRGLCIGLITRPEGSCVKLL